MIEQPNSSSSPHITAAMAERKKKLGGGGLKIKSGIPFFFPFPRPSPISNKRRPLFFFKDADNILDPSDAIFNGADNKKLHNGGGVGGRG